MPAMLPPAPRKRAAEASATNAISNVYSIRSCPCSSLRRFARNVMSSRVRGYSSTHKLSIVRLWELVLNDSMNKLGWRPTPSSRPDLIGSLVLILNCVVDWLRQGRRWLTGDSKARNTEGKRTILRQSPVPSDWVTAADQAPGAAESLSSRTYSPLPVANWW